MTEPRANNAGQPVANASGGCYEKVELISEDGIIGLAASTKRSKRGHCCKRWCCIYAPTAGAAFVLGCLLSSAVTVLVLRSWVGDRPDRQPGGWVSPDQLKANRARLRALIPNAEGLERHIAILTSRQSRAGTPGSAFHANYVADELRRLGYQVFNRTYSVLLSHLDTSEDFGVTLCTKASCGTKLRFDAPLTSDEGRRDDLPSIVPFTKPLEGDYQLITLEQLKLAVDSERNEERLTKLLANKVILADRQMSNFINLTVLYMTAGVLRRLAMDPRPGVPQYPNGTGVAKTLISMKTTLNTNVKGDPTTPIFPSKEYAVRLEGEPTLNHPDHPTIPISEADVEELRRFAETTAAATSGSGDGSGGFLRIRWPMRTGLAPIQDVCAEMQGALEPDRVVLVGGHRDAWHSGALDPHSGLSSLLELGRALAQFSRNSGWRPRRTLLLCTWDAEEWNLIGSAEWLDEEILRANRRLVGYVNTDTDIMGNWKVMVHAFQRWHGFLDSLIEEVPNPNPEEGITDPNYHFFVTPDTYSDYYIFWRNIGVPIVDLSYIRGNETKMVLYDLYHSRYDTLTLYRMIDPGGRAHLATVKNYLGIVYTLLDAPVLPGNMTVYASEIQETMTDLYQMAHNGSVRIAGRQGVNSAAWLALKEAFDRELTRAVESLKRFQTDRLDRLDQSSSLLDQRIINDKIMDVQKAFVFRSTYPHPDVVNLMAGETSLRVFRRIFRQELHDSHEFGKQLMYHRGNGSVNNNGVKQKHLEKLLETCILSLASVPKLLSDNFDT